MTPEQKERIKQAAVELGAALTWVGSDFDVDVDRISMTTVDSLSPNYGYVIRVTIRNEERIA